VLAIGLVVDDAIVVVEAVERHIEDGLTPKEAALKAMEEISGPVIGIALVLSAVFVPTAFIPGITGRLYQQFAVTIALSVVLSAFNALSLSPALSALLLKPRKPTRGPLGAFFRWFNRVFSQATESYVRVSGVLIRKTAIVVILLVAFGAAGFFVGGKLPTSFVPDEDQGFLYLNIQLPNAASLQRTREVTAKVEQILAKEPGVRSTTTVVGFSLLSLVRTSYTAFAFVTLKDWGERKDRAEQIQAIKAHVNQELSKIPEGVAFTFSPPAIPGVGTSGGFNFLLEDRSGQDIQFLADNVAKFTAAVRQRPEVAGLSTTFLPSVPQQFVDVDRDKVIKQGVQINDVYRTIQVFMGGLFVNYFNRFGRQWQVYVEAENEYRTKSENVGQFFVQNAAGQMVPLSALTKFDSRSGPEFTMRTRARLQQQPGHARAGGGVRADHAPGNGLRLFRHVVPGEKGSGRYFAHGDLRVFFAICVPDPRRAL
jgi:hydrophobic/amphiphilic exporter-1 (mainly G- bacteria), HAE1 family